MAPTSDGYFAAWLAPHSQAGVDGDHTTWKEYLADAVPVGCPGLRRGGVQRRKVRCLPDRWAESLLYLLKSRLDSVRMTAQGLEVSIEQQARAPSVSAYVLA